MADGSVTIIITSRSNKEQLSRCLEYVYAQDYRGEKDIVVVDNGSNYNSVFLVTSRYPQVKVVNNDINVGVGAAINQALAVSDSDYVAIIHQDVELEENWISTLVPPLESDFKIGSACSLVTQRKSKGSRLDVDSAGIAFRNGAITNLGEGAIPESSRFENIRNVFGVPGAAAMYKREMLEEIKINGECFDEDLFALYEDFDIALRGKLYKYKSLFVPGTKALHKKGILREGDKKLALDREILEVCNPLLLFIKCMPVNIYEDRKKPLKKEFRGKYFNLFKKHGLVVAVRTWFHFRKTRGKMIKKQRELFDDSNFNTAEFEREVFGGL